jgi:hypothetical protein
MARQDRQQPSAEQIALGRRIRTEVGQRATLDPSIQQTGQIQKLDEKRQLPKRRDRRFLVPADLEFTARRIDPIHGFIERLRNGLPR